MARTSLYREKTKWFRPHSLTGGRDRLCPSAP